MNRRKFLKYASASAAVVGASALGLDYLLTPQSKTPSQTSATAVSTSKFNLPPVANFTYTPKYLNPTDQQTVQFTNLSTDEDGDPLTYEWLVDNQSLSKQENYSTKLPVGQHSILLKASDLEASSYAAATLNVEPDQIYLTKPLQIRLKGMRMFVGWKGMNPIPKDVTDEKLDIVRNELGCNAVYIFGNTEFEDDLIEAGRNAITKGFDRIYVQPLYLDVPLDETVDKIGNFAKKIRALREMSTAVVFVVGHEFTYDSYGLVPGETYNERLLYPYYYYLANNTTYSFPKTYAMLPGAFRRIIRLCKANYGYQITYDATIEEGDSIVPWSDPIFESVGTSAYIWDEAGWTENWIAERLARLRKHGKPVNFSEWGTMTFKGAGSDFVDVNMPNSPYDEDEQADYIERYCDMVNKLNSHDRNNVNGIFYNQLDDERLKGYGLYKVGYGGASRKKGFYMYKSYQRSS